MAEPPQCTVSPMYSHEKNLKFSFYKVTKLKQKQPIHPSVRLDTG